MKHVSLDSKALLAVGASRVLALDPAAFTKGVMVDAIEPPNVVQEDAEAGDSIAIVSIRGPMAQRGVNTLCGSIDGYDRIAARFISAVTDPEVGAVVLSIDSPGGDVAGLEQALAAMVEAKNASDKPVFAFVDELAASAAYWIAASVASEIYAPAAAEIGSIGCIGALVDRSEALKAEGIAVTLIREPEGKAEAHPAQPTSELAIERATQSVKSAASRFFAAVSASRGLSTEEISALNGAVFEAPNALSVGLIDGVDSFSGVLARAANLISEKRMTLKLNEELAAKLTAAETLLASVQAITGKDTPEAAVGALETLSQAAARASEYEAQQAAATEKTAQEATAKAELIASLQAEQKLPKVQVAWAESVSLETLQGFAQTAICFGSPKVEQAATSHTVIDPVLEAELKRFGVTTAEHLNLKAKAEAKAKEQF